MAADYPGALHRSTAPGDIPPARRLELKSVQRWQWSVLGRLSLALGRACIALVGRSVAAVDGGRLICGMHTCR